LAPSSKSRIAWKDPFSLVTQIDAVQAFPSETCAVLVPLPEPRVRRRTTAST
jgi:hypothetical protein